ncbi:Sodium/calcium exchanger family protein [Coccidioides posadasii C735 delta SOWgp]|uniref:Sodium/calcium exchanger family protein n=1 Tax=Coccidioides posadasii (strain C735) TaxID=222929 RepID=C5PB25_COCP7|nr:Sodium/calcium exchanger family protein [Coccidioides posadasii C735 delta SOWgp]EER25809.1 Sodium/calcium exchanger family protein [Coccidioides posadasii C735 delta SOWgp]|eukprot:XP_003067954.1 Sodium/calcium exchanger family protein [Coccidioides posadasii C735 delta SOWgp]
MSEPSGESPLHSWIGAWLRTKSSNNRNPNIPILPLTDKPSHKHGATDHNNESRCASSIAPLHDNEKNASAGICDASSSGLAPPAPPPPDTLGHREESTAVTDNERLPVLTRIRQSLNIIIFSSWINILLIFVPVGIALGALHRRQGDGASVSPTVIFAVNAVAIIPLAYLLGFATESVARKMGDKVGALLNVTFGNAVELIIFLALVANEVRIVQASLLGSILANLLLILGMCFLFGGLRFREQLYNPAITQMSACLLSLSVMSLLLPTAFHASFNNLAIADKAVIQVSRGTSVILLLVYVLYLLFQLKSHAYIYESTPQHKIDEESHPGVLADILNSSSSSESSSSSDSDTDSSSGSRTTAKRIRRAINKRRRRKSSTSLSKESQSIPSTQTLDRVTSASHSIRTMSLTDHASFSPAKTIDPETISSGDEADREDAAISHQRYPDVTTHDFETGESHDASNKATKRHRKRHRMALKKEKTPSKCHKAREHSESRRNKPPERRVGFTEPAPTPTTSDTAKKPFMLRGVSRERIFPHLIPTLQPRLSSTEVTQRRVSTTYNGSPRILRRTTSLPDRLHQSYIHNPTVPFAQPLPHLMPIIPVHNESDGDSQVEEKPHLSRMAAVILLVVSTGLVAACAEFLVESIDYLVKNTGISQAFIGLIILPIVGNAAEHATAVAMAGKNKMDLAIGVALGSSIQIALFVTPIIVLLGWCLNTNMSLYFSLFETVSLFASAFIANYLMLDGRTNYLEGALLLAAYVIISVAAFFYPSCENLSSASNPSDAKVC